MSLLDADLPIRIRLRPTRAIVDLDAMGHNLEKLRQAAPQSRMMAILKADAYGHGLLRIAHELAGLGVDAYAVAYVEEGIALRQSGIEAPILVLGAIVDYQVKHFIDYHLELTASSLYKAKCISDVAKGMARRARVHFKVDTGMNRIGVRTSNALAFIREACSLPGLEPSGVFSHFADAEVPNSPLAQTQLADFLQLAQQLRNEGISLPLHMANSAATFLLPQSRLDFARPGIALYGCAPAPNFPDVGLRPAMQVETQVAFVKGIRQGTGVGYGHLWHAPHDGWLATLPVGYGDGYPRRLSNRAEVLICGKRCPVVGAISMDQCMVWLERENCDVGEQVVLLGSQGHECITAWELAGHADTIAYEILCGFTGRVPRVYTRGAHIDRKSVV